MASKKETTLKEIWDKLDENQKILRDIARWVRFQNISKLKEVLLEELDTDEKKLAFENTDGEMGIKEVAEIAKAPQDTVYGWWKKWSNLGILEPSETRKGRMRKICSLEDVGIKVPKGVDTKKEGKEPSKEAKTETTSEIAKA
jgi:hypothetical protein